MKKMINIYSGLFFGKGELSSKHVTWEFKPGACILPEGLSEGDLVDVKIVGLFEFDGFKAYAVEFNGLTKQQNGNPLHVTLSVPEGRTPGEVGFLMNDNPDCITKLTERRVSAKAGFFSVPDKN